MRTCHVAKNLFVTICINYSCSRHHRAHVRDVAFKRNATQLFHAQTNSPTTFLLTGSFSSTCCPSVVVMLLMVTASRALGTWWKGSVSPSVPRWMASSMISNSLSFVVTQGYLGVVFSSPTLLSE